MQLLHDLENVKEQFEEYREVMVGQEMQASLSRAALFLGEMHSLTFYRVLTTLGQIEETYLKDNKGQKEIWWINQVIAQLGRVSDLKVTFSNGYHVNTAFTCTDKINLESGCYNQDYTEFFKCI
jgi:hypothetical protein